MQSSSGYNQAPVVEMDVQVITHTKINSYVIIVTVT